MPAAGQWTGTKTTAANPNPTPAVKTPGDSLVQGDDKGVFVIHSTLLHTGNILMWSGHVEDKQYLPEAWLWNPSLDRTKAIRVPFPDGIDIFCCHHAQLPDGRILIVGGSMPHQLAGGVNGDSHGIKDICVYNPSKNQIDKIGQMHEARWYPTLVQLGDGNYVVFSGYTDNLNVPGDANEVAISAEILITPFK